MKGNFWVAAAAAMGLGLVLDLLLFQVLLGGTLTMEPGLRTPLAGPWPKIVAAALLFGWGFTWIYAQGIGDGPWLGQGLRFGLAAGVLTHGALGLTAATMLVHETETVIVVGIAGGIVRDVFLGLVVAYLMRPTGSGPS